VYEVPTAAVFAEALADARAESKATVIVVAVDRRKSVGSYESWWDVPVAEVSTIPGVTEARKKYEKDSQLQRKYYRATGTKPGVEAQLGGTRRK
jgi:3D-(3,5/4)-trihydroxycyclohexane-1,2-dione acylhydrolase (decyclizing)